MHFRADLGIALSVVVAVFIVLSLRWLFWSARERDRRDQGHRERHFALIGLGRIKKNQTAR
ncbi:hypothetical protein ACOYW6_05340 [Parablastomonas sp. CN1-191]|uniref:hypothetical protein n=1 Tax=Parablastomonas sp. CN1-191 TaxID=3400908 RepID=UPI003BF7B7F6